MVYHLIEQKIRAALHNHISSAYGLDVVVVTERPPRIELGEVASPVCFELAKRLKRAPRVIAQEITGAMGPIEGVARIEVAGGGYLNAFLDRAAYLREALARAGRESVSAPTDAPKVIVEHTNINPNKAAHIGHLRNAALGDSFVRLLKYTGRQVEVQNYIDNTGVQVADVVVGFQHLGKKTPQEVRALAAETRFDYLCWDLYAQMTHFYEEDAARQALRADALKAIEEGAGPTAEIAEIIAEAIVRLHLRTMERLDVEYDLLPRESEILHLNFWETAFEKLKATGAIQLAAGGKNAGCWVMRGGDAAGNEAADDIDAAKIIVRSNGTVTYVGKDIAYQLWKFGLLGKDFHYAKWPEAPGGHVVWTTTAAPNAPDAPRFGNAEAVYNVIDARQAYLQDVVVAGLRALGHEKEAANSIHFDYEIVALTPRCAAELGYELSAEDAKRPYLEVSGRKGFGVKADDLITRMLAAAEARVLQKQSEMAAAELAKTSDALAVGALRFFLLKFTRNTIIAFDFEDALKAEGETGPYCQYAVVRIRGIRRKGAEAGATRTNISPDTANVFLNSAEGNSLWELLVAAGSLEFAVEAAIATQEPAFVAKYAFQLAQAFNNFYHKHHILSEADERKRAFLLRLTELVEAQLVRALGLLGIEA